MTAEGDEPELAGDTDGAEQDDWNNLANVLSEVFRALLVPPNVAEKLIVKDKLTEVAETFGAPRSDSPYRAATWLQDLIDSVIELAYENNRTDGHMVALLEVQKRMSDLNLHTGTPNEFQFPETLFTELRHLGLDLPDNPADLATVRKLTTRLDELIDEANKVLVTWPDLRDEVVSILEQAGNALIGSRTQPRSTVTLLLDQALARATKVAIEEPSDADTDRRSFLKRALGVVAGVNLLFSAAQNGEWTLDTLGLGQGETPPIELTVECASPPLELDPGPHPTDDAQLEPEIDELD